MKISLPILVGLGLAPRAFAIFGVGDIVHDPINYAVLVATKTDTLKQWSTAIGKAESQIQNQVQQIEQGRALLTVQNQIHLSMGDWQTPVDKARSSQLSAQNLTNDHNGNLAASFVVDTGTPSLGYTNHGNFNQVATADAFGQPVTVPDGDLKRYAAVENVYEKALVTLQGTQSESQQINQEIADTYQEMTKDGITQQEYEKLRGKIQTLTVRQQALQAQRQDALAMIQAEETINQNQRAKEQAVSAQVQQSNHDALAEGLAQTQFDALPWR